MTVLSILSHATATAAGLFRCTSAGRLELREEAWLTHEPGELARYDRVWDQYLLRQDAILDWLAARGEAVAELSAAVAGGGLLRAVPSGTYVVGPAMLDDLRRGVGGEHASNLGGILAYGIARMARAPAFVVDPATVDEMDPVARLSGLPELPRRSVVHALNIRAQVRRVAAEMGREPRSLRLVAVHLGAGISVVAMREGRLVDVSNALESGPFSLERAGQLPTGDLIRMCFSGQFSERELVQRLTVEGGVRAHLGTADPDEVLALVAAGDEKACLVVQALCYQIGREVGAMTAALGGELDLVLLTGPLAAYAEFVAGVRAHIAFLGSWPVWVQPGSDELAAAAEAAARVLSGEEEARVYEPAEGEFQASFF